RHPRGPRPTRRSWAARPRRTTLPARVHRPEDQRPPRHPAGHRHRLRLRTDPLGGAPNEPALADRGDPDRRPARHRARPPLMVDLVTSNTDFYSGRNRPLVHQLCTYGDVLLLQEAKDMTLRDVLPADWRSLQNTSSDAKKGSCIAVDSRRVKVLEHYLTVGCGPPPGGGMMTRYIVTAVCQMRHNGAVFTAISAHYPPRRYAMQWEEYTTSLKRVRANVRGKVPVIGTDANMPIGQLAAKLNSKAYGVGIIG